MGIKKNPEFYPVKAVTKKESKKYSNDIILPKKYSSQFMSIREVLKRASKNSK